MSVQQRDKLITFREVVDLTGYSESTVYRWRNTGTGPKLFKRGGRIVAWESDVLAWLAVQEDSTATGGIR